MNIRGQHNFMFLYNENIMSFKCTYNILCQSCDLSPYNFVDPPFLVNVNASFNERMRPCGGKKWRQEHTLLDVLLLD